MMYKYIGCEALLNALKEERKNGNFVFTSKWIKEIIDHLPSADVVPKSEVDELKQDLEIAKIAIDNRNVELEGMRTAANSYKMHYEKAIKDVEVWKQNRFNLYQRLECYKMARQNVAREIFEEIEKITMHNVTSSYGIWLMSMGEDAFAELKKKYTGD